MSAQICRLFDKSICNRRRRRGLPAPQRKALRCRLLSPGADMRWREFIALAGGIATWPLVARAQQPISAKPVIGFLHAGEPEESASRLQAFRSGLRAAGYEGSQSHDRIPLGEG